MIYFVNEKKLKAEEVILRKKAVFIEIVPKYSFSSFDVNRTVIFN